MNTQSQINTDARPLLDHELDAVNGGDCIVTGTTIMNPKGSLTFGTVNCGDGLDVPYAIWTPNK